MNLSCIHSHTIFDHGIDDVETNCRIAYEKGLKSLGFSGHAPVTKKTGFRTDWHIPDERFEEYMDCVRAAKKRWEGKLPIYLGLEVDFIEGLIGPNDRDYREMGLDYIIGSVHYVAPPRGEPFTVDDSMEIVRKGIRKGYGGDAIGMVEAYFDAQAAMIHAGGFDVLGHSELVKIINTEYKAQNKEEGLFAEDAEFYRSKLAALAGLMATELTGENGLTTSVRIAEINTGGLNRGRIKECLPSLNFLKLFREQCVPIVINADAHKAEDLDGYYEEARKTLIAAGYTETFLFKGRENGKSVWEIERLCT